MASPTVMLQASLFPILSREKEDCFSQALHMYVCTHTRNIHPYPELDTKPPWPSIGCAYTQE